MAKRKRPQAQSAQSNIRQATAHPLFVQGLALHRQGRLAEADAYYQQVLAENPKHFDALHLSGVVAAQTKQAEKAVQLMTRALEIHQGYAAAYNNLGNVLKELGRHEEALQNYQKAIALKPDYVEAHSNLGNVYQELKQSQEALQSYANAIKRDPNYAEAYNNRGVVLQALGEYAEALENYHQAKTLNPRYVEAYYNLGTLLKQMGRYDEALQHQKKAIELDPSCARAHNNCGNILKALGQLDEALQCYERAIALQPDYATAHFNAALCYLQRGEFSLGWEAYEWRWKSANLLAQVTAITQPQWTGAEPLQGKRILLHSEQGFGDSLQFCRYARQVSALGAHVILEVQEALISLMQDLDGVAELIPQGHQRPAFDYHCPLLSLPRAFKTDLSHIPAYPSYIQPPAAALQRWQGRLAQKQKPRIGLVWSGNPGHSNDRQRSLALAEILPILHENYQFISLQKDLREPDRALLNSRPDILHLGDELHDFSDTAALCQQLDLVLSVDTSVVHLVGAMGKPIWVLLALDADWRWLRNRTDSPWYPSMKLYKQSSRGDWQSVLDRVKQDLHVHYSDYPN